MRQLKVRFTIEYNNEHASFSNRNELNQYSFSESLKNRLTVFEQTVQKLAAMYLVQKKTAQEDLQLKIETLKNTT